MFVLACHCLVVCSSPHAAEESFLCQQWPCSLTNKQIEKCLYLLMYKSPPQFLSCSIHIWARSLLRIEVRTYHSCGTEVAFGQEGGMDQCCPPSSRCAELAQCKVHFFHDLEIMSVSILTNYTCLQNIWHGE